MGCLQVGSGGGGIDRLLTVFVNGHGSTYYHIAGGGWGDFRRGVNELVTFFPQPSKVCQSVAFSAIVLYPLPQGLQLKSQFVNKKMWRTRPPVRIWPRLGEAHLGIDIGVMLSWCPQGSQGMCEKWVREPYYS